MKELHSTEEILRHLEETTHLDGVVFQGVPLTELEEKLRGATIHDSIFLGLIHKFETSIERWLLGC